MATRHHGNEFLGAFAPGQYVELQSRPGGDCYLVAFLSHEVRTGEQAWLRGSDLGAG